MKNLSEHINTLKQLEWLHRKRLFNKGYLCSDEKKLERECIDKVRKFIAAYEKQNLTQSKMFTNESR
jgi:hypothetical protein